MGIIYSIKCSRCGSLTKHYNAADAGTVLACENGKRPHVETDYAIRCPVCMHRLNTSEEDFFAQVEMRAQWR